jgi:hypothetical protein
MKENIRTTIGESTFTPLLERIFSPSAVTVPSLPSTEHLACYTFAAERQSGHNFAVWSKTTQYMHNLATLLTLAILKNVGGQIPCL